MIVTPEVTALFEKQLKEAQAELAEVTAWLQIDTSAKRTSFPEVVKRRKYLEDLVIVLEAAVEDKG